MRLSIRARLTAWYTLLAAVTLVGVGAFLVLKLRSDLRSAIDREVRSSVSVIRQSYLAEAGRGFAETSSATLRLTNAAAQVLDARGHVLALYGGDLAQDPLLTADLQRTVTANRPWLRDVELGDAEQPYRVAATAVTRNDSRQLVVVAESLAGINAAVRKVLLLLLIVGPIVLAALAAAGWLLVRNALVPVDRMRRKADRIGINQLHERLSAPNPSDQIGQLAGTLNAMLDRLEAGVAARRQLVADASHELRTPLAAMRAELDVTLRQESRTPAERSALESVREDVDRMSRTVDNLLTLALADEGGLELLRTPVEIAHVARAAVDPLRALAALGQVTLAYEGEAGWTTGDPQRLTQALTNLIENAIKFTPAGGQVTVATWHRGPEVGISVIDTGIGIDDDAGEHIFERFYRADRSRSRASGGSGLGLAICKEIAVAHGGRIWVQSEPGHGSTFSIALPAERPPPQPADPVAGAHSAA